MLRRLSVKWPRHSVRPKSTAAAESPQAPKGLFRSARIYLRSGGLEDLTAIGVGFGGLTVGASAIYFIVGSVQSSHEKISILTEVIQKERELRVKDVESLEKLRAKDIESLEKLRAEGIQKERELREKDAAIMRAERIAYENELRATKLELQSARGK